MSLNQPVVIIYGSIVLFALGMAFWRRKTFPFGEALPVMLIIGVGFTAAVALLVPEGTGTVPDSNAGELTFVLAYLVFVTILLVLGMPPWMPKGWETHFLKKKIFTGGYKVLVYVIVPLIATRLFWQAEWATLGFSSGDVASQLRSAGLLFILFGGFNLLLGGAAAPIRARKYSGKQVALGFSIGLLWNIIETGLVEEFFFRAFLQTRLITLFDSPLAGICVASLLFGLAHVPGLYLRKGGESSPLGEHPTLLNAILYGILVLSTAGWFTGLLYWRTQSLLAPILVHAGVDAVASTVEFIKGLGLDKQTEEPA